MTIKLAELQFTNLSTDSDSLKDLSETEQKIQGGIWSTGYDSYHYYISGGYEYAGGYDNDAGVCEPINSSGG